MSKSLRFAPAALIPVCLLSFPMLLAGCGPEAAPAAKPGSAPVTPSIEQSQKEMEEHMKNQAKK